jgi:hypothetical protein
MAETEYFETFGAIAEFLAIPLDEFLRWRNSGRFPLLPKPRDPTPVFFKADIEAWDKAGRPCRWGCLVGLAARSERIVAPT